MCPFPVFLQHINLTFIMLHHNDLYVFFLRHNIDFSMITIIAYKFYNL
jgi:hypothetical protein